jgi:hypothetical protein
LSVASHSHETAVSDANERADDEWARIPRLTLEHGAAEYLGDAALRVSMCHRAQCDTRQRGT